MEDFADPIIGRLTGREVSPLDLTDVDNIEDLRREIKKARIDSDDKRYDLLEKHVEDLFASQQVQEQAFENVSTKISEAEGIEIEEIEIEPKFEGLRKSQLARAKGEQLKKSRDVEIVTELVEGQRDVDEFKQSFFITKQSTALTLQRRFPGIDSDLAQEGIDFIRGEDV